jgi:hypothetical protein
VQEIAKLNENRYKVLFENTQIYLHPSYEWRNTFTQFQQLKYWGLKQGWIGRNSALVEEKRHVC